MNGYVASVGDRWYAVIYEGLDPVTGKERRRWHPAGESRADAERLASALAEKVNGRNNQVRSLTFGACLATRWLPGKKLEVAHSTWDGSAASSISTFSRHCGRSRSVASDPTTWNDSTTTSSTERTASGRWHPRPSWRYTSCSPAAADSRKATLTARPEMSPFWNTIGGTHRLSPSKQRDEGATSPL